MYVGKARGFAEQGYEYGVTSYRGYFASVALNVGPKSFPTGVGLTAIEAAPLLDPDKLINPGGVFATYFGVGLGAPIPLSSPVNSDIAVTNYTLRNREKYLTDSEVPKKQQDINTRKTIAAKMAAEIMSLGWLWPGGIPFAGSAIGELWRFTDDLSN
jgi:hypothetical protein